MEENRQLYPMRFTPLVDSYSWGFESFDIADLGYRDSLCREGFLAGSTLSEILDMYIDRVVGEKTFEITGRQFPLQIKTISVETLLPLVVCPDDETAVPRYDFLGKTKLWYILEADRNACIYLGWKRDVEAAEVMAGQEGDVLKGLLRRIPVRKGQVYTVEPGCVHSAEGKVRILEISQSSPLDFCISGLGNAIDENQFDPQLNLVEALDFINFSERMQGSAVAEMPFITTAIHRDAEIEQDDAFSLLSCVSGEATILSDDESFSLREGESILLPAELEQCKLSISADNALVLRTVMNSTTADSYIDPSVAATLDGEPVDDDEDSPNTFES